MSIHIKDDCYEQLYEHLNNKYNQERLSIEEQVIEDYLKRAVKHIEQRNNE